MDGFHLCSIAIIVIILSMICCVWIRHQTLPWRKLCRKTMQIDSVEASDLYQCKYCFFKVMSRAELKIHLEATHHTTGLMRDETSECHNNLTRVHHIYFLHLQNTRCYICYLIFPSTHDLRVVWQLSHWQLSHRTLVPLDNCPTGHLSPWHLSHWTFVPLGHLSH